MQLHRIPREESAGNAMIRKFTLVISTLMTAYLLYAAGSLMGYIAGQYLKGYMQ